MQTDYNDLAAAIEGGLADSSMVTEVISRKAAVAITFGKGVILTANQDEVTLPSATGFIMSGVALAIQKAQTNAANAASYAINDAVSVLRKGRVWVLAETVVDPTQPVYLRHTANAGTTAPGRFGNTADTAKADLIANARWLTKTTGIDQLAQLEINLP